MNSHKYATPPADGAVKAAAQDPVTRSVFPRQLFVALSAMALIANGQPSAAQQAPVAEATTDIVVTARRANIPMWEASNGRSTLLLVGEITEVPKTARWRPDALQAATTRANRVILGIRAKISPGDVFRLLFKGGKLKKLPEGRTVADYLSPAEQGRLARLMPPGDSEYQRRSLLLIAFDLMTKQVRFTRNTADNATDVVRRAAQRARIIMRPVDTVRGKDLLDTLFEAPPATHKVCLKAAMTAAEEGPGGVERRGQNWARADVVGVMASPIEAAVDRCWPWGDGGLGSEVRAQWLLAIDEALTQPGVTLAVVPLRVLAEHAGVLDRLEARHLELTGPAWRE